jgi:prepilin-type N-terminal cleavage/methylation domain-containing protein
VSNLLKKDKGFTLIEIVLVMAIAGLILVIVFLAVQGAQRSRRDNARKHDAARMLAAVESCAGNANGAYANCTTQAQIVTAGYFNPNVDPNGNPYTVGPASQTSMLVSLAATCPGSATVHPATVQIGQESGPNYCVGN